MTEEEWLASTNWQADLRFITGMTSFRKHRLCEVAMARVVIQDVASLSRSEVAKRSLWAESWGATKLLEAIAFAELFVDGSVSEVEFVRKHEDMLDASAESLGTNPYAELASLLTRLWEDAGADVDSLGCFKQYSSRMTCLLRDIFGNPFRPVAFDPAWQTSSAIGIALQMYDSRDFGAMPILADALQDAGCENEDILTHCRDSATHVRGCWVVDLVLGKE